MYNWEKFLKSKTWANKNDILLLANVFDKLLKNVSWSIWTCPCSFFYCTRINMALKKTRVKLDLLNDIDMLSMSEKGIRGGICHAFHSYAKTNKYTNDCNINKESSYLNYWNKNNFYRCTLSQKLLVDDFMFTKNNLN